jgi:multiple sugar transport system substrate-binding protein
MNRPSKWLVLCSAVSWLLTTSPACAADLTVWWNKGWYPEEDEGIRRITAAFERETGNSVELNLYPQSDMVAKLIAALAAQQPPDVVFSYDYGGHEIAGPPRAC